MVQGIRKVVFVHKNSNSYVRSFANGAAVQPNPQSEIVIDFYEEYTEPVFVMEQFLDTDPPRLEYNKRDHAEVTVWREFKSSITMSKSVARDLVRVLSEVIEAEDNQDET